MNIDNFFIHAQPAPFSFLLSLTQAFFAGIGFTLALLLMAGIRERLQVNDAPKCFEGIPVAFIIASLMSLAFMGFSGFRF